VIKIDQRQLSACRWTSEAVNQTAYSSFENLINPLNNKQMMLFWSFLLRDCHWCCVFDVNNTKTLLGVYHAKSFIRRWTIKHSDREQQQKKKKKKTVFAPKVSPCLTSASSNHSNHSIKRSYRTRPLNTRSNGTVVRSLYNHVHNQPSTCKGVNHRPKDVTQKL